MLGMVKRLWKDEGGMQAAEESLLLALIAIAFMLGGALLGVAMNDKFASIAATFDALPP